jgi:serine/threonine-protein kinase
MNQEGRKPLDDAQEASRPSGDRPAPAQETNDRSTGMKLVNPQPPISGIPRPQSGIPRPDSAAAPPPGSIPQPSGPLGNTLNGLPQGEPVPSGQGGMEHNPTLMHPEAEPVSIPQAPLSADSRPPPPPNSDQDPYLGCTIDNRYRVESLLGEGGMGVVYQCRHKIIDKKVAMKILRAELAREKEVTDRFLIEAKAASAIDNEHVIDISDFGQLPDGSAYFVMEFLDGVPLSAIIAEGRPLPTPRIVHLSLQLAKGLEAAHNAGIVHRDLKPDNIFLIRRAGNSEFVKVLDFGIAKVSTAATGRLTQAGSVFGTPHYMSPEQAAGAPVDHRGDIYAVGVILFELATGRLPFEADNFMAILTQHIYKAPTLPRSLVADVPPELEAIILKCLSKKPEQRYQSMLEFAEDLRRFEEGRVPLAIKEMMERPDGFDVPPDFFKRRDSDTAPQGSGKRWPLVALLAVLAAGGAGLFAFSQSSPASIAPDTTLVAQVAPVAAAATPEVPAPAEPEAPKAPETTQVVLAVEPLTAHVFAGDEDLGMSPVVVEVEVPQGERVQVEVRQPGYKPHSLTLDGKTNKLSVSLEPIKRAPAARPAAEPIHREPPAAKPKSSPQIGGGEIVNPWAGG